jgi:hypothetical protein
MHEHLRQEVHTALLGHADTVIRREFIRRFSSQFDAFEAALLAAYERWCQLDSAFAKDRDSATVVGTTFIVVARLTMSTNLLTLGQITLSGAAFRHAIEALACAFVFADPDCPHRPAAWEGKFSVNKAVSILSKQAADDPRLDRKALDVMVKVRQFYDKLSHPTVFAMGDVIDLGEGGHHLGASFDEAKLPFYELELASRVGFAQILPNAFEGIEGRMLQWPRFKNGPAAIR